jgi:hypothetical protein
MADNLFCAVREPFSRVFVGIFIWGVLRLFLLRMFSPSIHSFTARAQMCVHYCIADCYVIIPSVTYADSLTMSEIVS